MPCTDGSELQPPTSGSSARATTAALSGPRREKSRVISGPRCGKGRVLDVIEDLAALSLEFALRDGSALAKLVQLTHVRDQVHERRRKPLVQMQVFFTVELGRPGVPRLEIKERFEGGIRDTQGLDAVFIYRHEPHGDAIGGVLELTVEVAFENLAVLEADRDFCLRTRLLVRRGLSRSEGNTLDRGQRDERALVVAGLIEHLELEIGLVQADGGDLAFHDLVVKKSDGDGGGFSGPGTAHLWPS